ncbi:MAG: transcriptional regulator [Candidatus Bathyarchaeota archaeon]|jgi:YHS domain-containing protein|nr:transcriptional regulator [Candidatus Bathyarchaeota archaeon]
MKTFKKCELCNLELAGEKCAFAVHKRVIGGKEHYFCCEHHADEFEKRHRERE